MYHKASVEVWRVHFDYHLYMLRESVLSASKLVAGLYRFEESVLSVTIRV